MRGVSTRTNRPRLDAKGKILEICWTGDVGPRFPRIDREALQALCPYTESAAEIEVSYYHDDGQDEFGMVFIGRRRNPFTNARKAA